MSKTTLTPTQIEAAAAQALGGPPVRLPVLPTQPIAKAPAVPTGDVKARQAFAEKQKPAPAITTGNPTFDAPPPALQQRSAKVRIARERLSNIITTIERERTALLAELDALLAEADAVKIADGFDPAAALLFLGDLHGVIENLTPKPAPKPAKPKAEN